MKKGVALKTSMNEDEVRNFLLSLHTQDGWYAAGYAVRPMTENPHCFEFIQNGAIPKRYLVLIEGGTIYANQLKGYLASYLADKDIPFTFDQNPELPHAIRNILETIARKKGSTVEA